MTYFLLTDVNVSRAFDLPSIGGIQLRNQHAPKPLSEPPATEQPQDVPRYWLSVDDLFVVKRTRVEYQLGEVAHVENVMAREERRRTHKRLDETETTTTTERASRS